MDRIDRLVWLVWRAFWVGLGACAVLVVQAATHPAGQVSRAPEASASESAPAFAPAKAAPPALRPGV